MSLYVIINSLNKNKLLFIQYGVSNVTDAFLSYVSIVLTDVNIKYDIFVRILSFSKSRK